MTLDVVLMREDKLARLIYPVLLVAIVVGLSILPVWLGCRKKNFEELLDEMALDDNATGRFR
jgi:hypothetical protein